MLLFQNVSPHSHKFKIYRKRFSPSEMDKNLWTWVFICWRRSRTRLGAVILSRRSFREMLHIQVLIIFTNHSCLAGNSAEHFYKSGGKVKLQHSQFKRSLLHTARDPWDKNIPLTDSSCLQTNCHKVYYIIKRFSKKINKYMNAF